MNKIVNFAANQKVTVDDVNNMGLYARDGLDNVVHDAVGAPMKYAGGQVTIVATTKVAVAVPVRLYSGGRVYNREQDDAVEIDLLSVLPTAGFKRVAAITLTGSTQTDKVEERDFLVNAATRETQAAPTATRSIRLATVNTVAGAAAVDPAVPATPTEHLAIAYVTLTPTGIESVTQITANRLASIIDIDGRLRVVEIWKDQTQPIIDGLRSDVAALRGASRGNESRSMVGYLLEQVARLSDRVGIDPAAAFSKTDWFLETDDSDLENPQYLAKVEEGLRFANDAEETSSPVLSNPADTRFVVTASGLLLPSYSHTPFVSNIGKDSEIAISNAGSQNVELRKRTESKTRVRWGSTLSVCTNSAMWRTGRYDPTTNIFTAQTGETYELLDPANAVFQHVFLRLRQFWTDTYEEIYWDVYTTTASFVGTVAAQTFLVPRAAWLTKVKIGFSRKDTQGDLHLAIARVTASGAPDPQNVLATVTVDVDDIKVYPALTEIAIPPIYAEAGERLAIIMITAGNHWLAMAENNKYAQGTFFTSTDAAWFQGDISRDCCFEVCAAAFAAPRVVIDLDPWSCTGGIADLDMLLYQVAPDPTSIVFEVKINNVWTPVAAVDPSGNHPLHGLPASINARMVMIGTTEVMPGIFLSKSKVTRSRPRVNGVHISTARNTPVAITEASFVALLEGFNDANHDVAAKLLYGAGYGTEASPAATTDETLPDGTIRRTWTFTGLPNLTTFKRKVTYGTNSALDTFHVANLTDIALP